jgi:outer membrane protein TolC
MKRFVFFSLCLCGALWAAEISLDASLQQALQYNEEILASSSARDAAQWQARQAFTALLPKSHFTSTMVRIDDETYDAAKQVMPAPVLDASGMPTGSYVPLSAGALSGGMYKTTFANSITLQQPIFNGGKVILGYTLAKEAAQQAAYAQQDVQNNISYRVAATYFNLLKLNEMRAITAGNLHAIQLHLQEAQHHFEQGISPYSDVLQWKVQQENQRIALQEIDNNCRVVTRIWAQLLGYEEQPPQPQPITLADWDGTITNYASFDSIASQNFVRATVQEIVTTNPTLQTLRSSQKMAKTSTHMAMGSFLPSLNLQFDYQIERDDTFDFSGSDSWNLAAVLSVPLFNSGSNYAALRQAQASLRQVTHSARAATNGILAGAEASCLNLLTAAKNVQRAKTAEEYARENHAILSNLYAQGMSTNGDLQDAQTMLQSAELTTITAYYDFIIQTYELKKWGLSQEEK